MRKRLKVLEEKALSALTDIHEQRDNKVVDRITAADLVLQYLEGYIDPIVRKIVATEQREENTLPKIRVKRK